MIPKLILQIFPLPLESVQIGSLITDPLHPYEDIANGSTTLDLEKDCIRTTSGPRLEQTNKSSTTNVVVRLLNWLFGSLEHSNTSSQTISADNTCAYELRNPNGRFKDLVSQEAVQKWIQEQVELGNTIHLITGIQTTVKQRTGEDTKFKLSVSGSATTDPATAAVSKVLGAEDSDQGVRASHVRSEDTKRSLSTDEERVVAIRIRRVDIHEADDVTLDQKNRSVWKMVGDQRAENPVEQVVEAVLQEEDDDCGGLTEVLEIGEGDTKLAYVALEGSDKEIAQEKDFETGRYSK